MFVPAGTACRLRKEHGYKMIYLDNAATTRVSEAVFEAIKPFFCEQYANPSAIYSFAGKSMTAVDAARRQVAALIGAEPNEIYFTSGGSESDNWAIKAAAEAHRDKGRHIITSAIEHHAVLHTCQMLEKQGYEVTYVNVDENGLLRMEELERAIRPDTILITVMAANNEIGTIQPLAQIGALAQKHGILFHTDAVQAYGHIPLDVNALHIDMLSASGHKLHAPKGVGCLYIRKGVRVGAFLHGGAQERSRRAGTLNTAGIVGMGEAARLAGEQMEENAQKERELRDYLIARVLSEIPYSRLNGDSDRRLPGNANFSFRFVEGESVLILLDQQGICASSGSACTSGALDPSHVLLAIGLPHEIAHGSLRLTLSAENTKEELDFTVERLKEIIKRLRDMSPLYEDFVKQKSVL